MLSNHSRHYSKECIRYVKRYGDVLKNPSKISQITILSKDQKRMAMAGLANLSKFLGCYEYWRRLVRNAGLKWEKKVSLDIVLDIMNTNLQDCWTWLKEVLEQLPSDFGSVLVFAVLTGLRPGECVKSTKLISELTEKGRLEDYLNKEFLMLEHFRYGDLFLRKYKNAYISFVTPELLDLITSVKPKIKYTTLYTKVHRLGLPNRTKELRKYFATKLRENLPTEAVDLLQGRINRSVFLRYYYKPFLKDIRNRTIKGIKPLQKELLETLS